jgi:anti-sigma regulatory factor (Ser/Thr protein kinase)/AmiR/NasT family two-component response regulator
MSHQTLESFKKGFLATVSHELRTPINGILGLSMALASAEATEAKKKQLDVISNSAKAMLTLVTDILDRQDLSEELTTLVFEKIDIFSIVREVTDLMQTAVDKRGKPIKKDGVDLKLEIIDEGKSSSTMEVDKDKINKILISLVENALKFTSKGSVSVTAKITESGVEIAVSDQGIGISKENIERIFKPFEQEETDHENRKYEGLGLGLSRALDFAKLHGGSIKVASEVGKGSVFTVLVPFDAKEKYNNKMVLLAERDEKNRSMSFTGTDEELITIVRGMCRNEILYVEPDLSLHLEIERLFRAKNFKVITVADSNEGRTYIKTHPTPDAVILANPEWDSDMEFIHRHRSRAVPVLIFREFKAKEEYIKATTTLASAIIEKPATEQSENLLLTRLISALKVRYMTEFENKQRINFEVMSKVLPKFAISKIRTGNGVVANLQPKTCIVHCILDDSYLEIATEALGITEFSTNMSKLVNMFEDLCVLNGLYSVGVTGLALTAIAGLVEDKTGHFTEDKALKFAKSFLEQAVKLDPKISIFCGVHSGVSLSCVVGGKLMSPHFVAISKDIKIAQLLAITGVPNRIHLSDKCHDAIKYEFRDTNMYAFQDRGMLPIPNSNDIKTYVLKNKTSEDLRGLKVQGKLLANGGAGGAGGAGEGGYSGSGISVQAAQAIVQPIEELVGQLAAVFNITETDAPVTDTALATETHPIIAKMIDLESEINRLLVDLNDSNATLVTNKFRDGRLSRTVSPKMSTSNIEGINDQQQGRTATKTAYIRVARNVREGQVLELQKELEFLKKSLGFLLEEWKYHGTKLKSVVRENTTLTSNCFELKDSFNKLKQIKDEKAANILHEQIDKKQISHLSPFVKGIKDDLITGILARTAELLKQT